MHPGPQQYVTKRGANHTLHIVLSVVTCGLWAITGWPIAAAMGRKTSTTVYPGGPPPAQWGQQPGQAPPQWGQPPRPPAYGYPPQQQTPPPGYGYPPQQPPPGQYGPPPQ